MHPPFSLRFGAGEGHGFDAVCLKPGDGGVDTVGWRRYKLRRRERSTASGYLRT